MKQRLLMIAAIVVLVAAVFGGIATHQFIAYDDPEYVTNNAVVQRGLTLDGLRYAFTSLTPYYWQPLTWLSLMGDVSLWGVKAGPPLVENVLLHAISAVLLFLTFAKFGERRAFALAAIWAIHPLRVESVAWVAERKDVLSTLFFIAAMLAYVNGRKALVIAAFILAVMAKPMALTLPIALLLLDYWPLNRRPSFLDKIPLFAIAAAVLILTFIGQAHAIGGIPITKRLANVITSYVAYLGKMIAPVDLAVVYPYRFDIDARSVVVAIIVLVALTVAALMRKKYAAMGWLWYVITIVPVIGIVQVGAQAMADRFTYIPSIGIIAAVVWLVADLAPRAISTAIAAIAIVLFAVVSFQNVAFWRDSETLFLHALDVTKDNIIAELALGDSLQAQGRTHDATEHYLAAARLSRGAPLPLATAGAALMREHRYAEAVPLLQKALAANPNEPDAKENLRIALAAETKDYDARMNSAVSLSQSGRDSEALAQFEAAQQMQPSSVEPRIYRALMLANLGRRADAAAAAQEAKQMDAKASNDFFTRALHMPPNDANLDQFIAAMRSQR